MSSYRRITEMMEEIVGMMDLIEKEKELQKDPDYLWIYALLFRDRAKLKRLLSKRKKALENEP